MYDYVKLSSRIRDVEGYKRASELIFTQAVEIETGDITTPFSNAKVDNMDIRLNDKGYIEVKGSIHKYYNGGTHNHNDFSYEDFISSVEELSGVLKLDLWQFKVDALEIGVNITPPIKTSSFLSGTYMHGRKPFKDISVGEGGDYRQAVYKDYWVKIYDKGRQYNLPYQLLRYELKLRADELRRMDLKYLHELKDNRIIERLGQHLVRKFEDVVFLEPSLNREEMPSQHKGKYSSWCNPRYWQDLAHKPPSKNSYRKEMTLLSEVQVSHTENVKDKALQLIQKKWGELVHVASAPEANSGRISSSGIGLKFPTPRKCLVTGLDISMQKKESLFLYTTGVMYYYDHHPGTYRDLEDRLSSKWDQESFEVRCREIAHSIRNEYHNRRKALLAKRSTRNDQLTLFSYVSLEDKSLIDQYGIAS